MSHIAELKRPVSGVILDDARRSAGNTVPDPAWGTINKGFQDAVASLVNDHRASLGLSELLPQSQLVACAEWKAMHMTGFDYMDHADPAPPVARSTAQRFSDFGYSGSWGENIAYGYTTPAAVMSGWLNSPGHKANIERANYRGLGVGSAWKSGGRVAWCQCFGDKSDSPPPPPPPPPTGLKLKFSDRHAIGVVWNKLDIPSATVMVYIWTGLNWSVVRTQANSGDTFLTYPLDYSGQARVKIAGGGVEIDGAFDVRPVRIV